MTEQQEKEPGMFLGETPGNFVVAIKGPADEKTEVFKMLFTFSESFRVFKSGRLAFLFDKSLFSYNGKSPEENFRQQAAEIAEIGGIALSDEFSTVGKSAG